jgi:hypothetical protein
MSMFHRYISVSVKELEDAMKMADPVKKRELVRKVEKELREHHQEVLKVFQDWKGEHQPLVEYIQHLDSAIQILKHLLGVGKVFTLPTKALINDMSIAIKQLENAYNYVISLEQLTRKLLGDEHKFLE